MDINFALVLLLKAWGLVALMMTALWFVQVKTKNASYVDIGWTLGLGICVIVYAMHANGLDLRKVFILMLVLAWCARLTKLLTQRLLKDPSEDSRYARIRVDWKTNQNFKFFWMFQFQGFLDVVLSWPFLLICFNQRQSFHPLEIAGIALSLISLLGESIADQQLRDFKNNPSNKGKTCDVGLWYYSRHPNYFFEWLIWVGYFIFALTAPWGITAIIAPMLMIIFLLKVSGIPLAEAQALKTKGEAYRHYQATTSMFVPLPKRKSI
jgi:steroid 5-alpha reductase family enzyme